MLTDTRFWVGVAAGVVGVYGWKMYKTKKSA